VPDEILVESRRHLVDLTESQAATLRSLGKQLASSKTFWGHDDKTDEAERVGPARSVVRCTHAHDETYEVTVSEAVGIIALPDLQLIVHPKIPHGHFHHLMSRSPSFPRIIESLATGAESTVLWDLVAAWYLSSLERLLRHGLLSDYEEESDLLPAVRGSVRLQETALAYYQGSTLLACDFDEFTPDTALNRVMRAASLAIAQAPFLDHDLRRRARRSLVRMNEIGRLRRNDLRAALDRRTARYEAPLTLARHVLAATGRTFDVVTTAHRRF
jgi:5-methylcytosine-specific restriction enzyme subunit McrC